MSNWIRVFSSQQEWQAAIVRDRLGDEQIPAVVLPKKDSAYLFGYYEVMVPDEHALAARKLIDDEVSFG